MNLKLETEFSKAEVLKEVDALKKQIDGLRPLPDDVEGRVMQKLRLDWNYNSNAIEGNKLSYGETVAFLMEGITAKGKPLKDHLDIRGHNEAINFLLEIVKDPRPISEADIRALHKMVLVEPYDSPATTAKGLPTTKRITLGEYKTQPNHVKTSTGEIHYYASPEETPAKMHELMDWLNAVNNDKTVHPVVSAALFHHKFVSIHPFDDGNGRLSRILMNLILMQQSYPPVIIKMDDRTNYYSLLSRADNGDNWPFIEYITERLKSSLQIYLKGAVGDDIDEDEDIDKEIALFKMELQSRFENKKDVTPRLIFDIVDKDIMPLILVLIKKTETLDDLFYQKITKLNIDYIDLVNNSDGAFFTTGIYENLIFPFPKDCRILKVELEIKFNKFKEVNNFFDVTASLSINFTDTGYQITNHNDDLNIVKSYNENLNPKDKKNISNQILRDIKDLISFNLQ